MFFKTPNKIYAIFLLLTLGCTADAGVSIGGTRFIYNEGASQAAISVTNPDDKPYLIQSWVDKDSEGEQVDDTFVATPPIFKLEAKSQNSVRLVYTGKPLPQDKESVFWLNIKSIPTSDKQVKNQLLLSVNSRMKLFYRPAGLNGEPNSAYKDLLFSYEKGKVKITNPTPYNVSVDKVSFDGKEKKDIPMIPAKGYVTVATDNHSVRVAAWSAINDFGAISDSVSKNIE